MSEQLWTLDVRGLDDPVTACLEALAAVDVVTDVDSASAAMLEREADGTTYVGCSMALPHIIGSAARKPGMLAARCDPIAWGDVEVSLLLFLIAPDLDYLADSSLAQIIHRIVVIGLDAPAVPIAHQQIIELFQELEASPIERKGTSWA